MNVTGLIERINRQDDVSEAALALGLLLEQAHRRKFGQDNAEDIKEILGDDYSDIHLSESEAENVLSVLIDHVENASIPDPMVLWALTKSFDPRVLPLMIGVLDRFAADPRHEHLAVQALSGVALYQTDQSISAMERAANSGYGEVQRSAQQFLGRART